VVPGTGTGYDGPATNSKEKMMSQRSAFLAAVVIFALLGSAVPAEAQREYEPLFDKFNFKLEGGIGVSYRSAPA